MGPAYSAKDPKRAISDLAKFVAQLAFDDIPVGVRERAKLTILDTLGVAIKGSGIQELRNLINHNQESGEIRLWAPNFPRTNDPIRASFINTTAICAVELDEISTPSAHPALHTLPVITALAQQRGSSGIELMTAFVAGYEVHQRLQQGVVLRKDVYPHGNLGYVGTMAGIGKLLSWTSDQILNAMNCVASLPLAPSYHNCISGNLIAATFASFTAAICVQTIDLIEAGFTASEGSIEATFGQVLGQNFNSANLTAQLGTDFALEHNNFKFHACCGVIHPALEAVADALNFSIQHEIYPPFKPADLTASSSIRAIRLRVAEPAMRMAHIAGNGSLAGKFSLPFAVASFIQHQHASFDAFDADAMSNPDIKQLQQRVTWAELSESPALAEAEIEFDDGSIRRGSCMNIYGRAGFRSTDQDVQNKFHSLTRECLGTQVSKTLMDEIFRLDTIKNVARLFDGLNYKR